MEKQVFVKSKKMFDIRKQKKMDSKKPTWFLREIYKKRHTAWFFCVQFVLFLCSYFIFAREKKNQDQNCSESFFYNIMDSTINNQGFQTCYSDDTVNLLDILSHFTTACVIVYFSQNSVIITLKFVVLIELNITYNVDSYPTYVSLLNSNYVISLEQWFSTFFILRHTKHQKIIWQCTCI